MRYTKTAISLGYRLRHMLKCRDTLLRSSEVDIPTLRYIEGNIARLKSDVMTLA